MGLYGIFVQHVWIQHVLAIHIFVSSIQHESIPVGRLPDVKSSPRVAEGTQEAMWSHWTDELESWESWRKRPKNVGKEMLESWEKMLGKIHEVGKLGSWCLTRFYFLIDFLVNKLCFWHHICRTSKLEAGTIEKNDWLFIWITIFYT